MNIVTQAEAERAIDEWRSSLCPACQKPSPTRFCSEWCRQSWWQAYKSWLKSEGHYQLEPMLRRAQA